MYKIIGTALIAAIPTMGFAQLADSAMSMLYDNTRSNMMENADQEPPAPRYRPPAASSNAQAPRLSFQSTPATARAAQSAMLGRLDKTNPAAAKALADVFARHDFSAIVRSLMSGSGLRPDDLGDVFTAYTALGYMIANNESGNPDPQALRALRNQLAGKLAANPQTGNPRNRASLGEDFKLLFATLHADWQSAQRAGNLPTYSRNVAKLFREQGGIDLRRVRLTRAGFVAR